MFFYTLKYMRKIKITLIKTDKAVQFQEKRKNKAEGKYVNAHRKGNFVISHRDNQNSTAAKSHL